VPGLRGGDEMTFHIGQKVVCVYPFKYDDLIIKPRKGRIYTIRVIDDAFLDSLEKCPKCLWYFRFNEIPGDAISFGSCGFRPLEERQTDISVFTGMLKKKFLHRDLQL
jgi:hypothetical protein